MGADRKRKFFLQLAVSAAAVGFLIYGISRGEMDTVLHKAVNICMECIGLG